MSESEEYVTPDYLRKAAKLVQDIKQATYGLMRVQPGNHVLDMGCGPGLDTVPLAGLAGPEGRVTGIDIDPEMLEQADAYAREKGLEKRITHRQGDVAALPFADDTFDACRAERLLQVLPDTHEPHAVVAEMKRVTRKNGWVVAADTDWATASVDFGDPALERKLLHFFAGEMRPNGYAGRQLFRLFKGLGFTKVSLELFPILMADIGQTPFGDWLQKEALAAGIASQSELELWRAELEKLSARKEFYGSVNMIVVAGQKP